MEENQELHELALDTGLDIPEEKPDEQWIVTGQLYTDNKATILIRMPIGPFDTFDDAKLFMWRMKPVWGSFEIVQLWSPKYTAEANARPGAYSE